MKGIELCEGFYLEYGAKMIHDSFPQLEGLLAIGVAGSGSECFGYDDSISQDHDFEPGFCIFLPDESLVDRKTEFALERAYSKLPEEFMGYKRQKLSAVGGNRHGVMRISDFMIAKTGKADGELSLEDWFIVPEQALLEATDGKIFCDGLGLISSIRSSLSYMPEDVRRKKLAGELLMMGQTGQYNYGRCIARGECAAAQLALAEFVRSTIHVCSLLDKKYMPYYKWSFRALRESLAFSLLCADLEYLISSSNNEEEFKKKLDIIENVCGAVINALRAAGLSGDNSNEMEAHAYSVNSSISNSQIRNLHILYGV